MRLLRALFWLQLANIGIDAARFNIDVSDFDASLAKARASSNEEKAAYWYEQAVGLYQGEYLQNLYYDWLFPERRRLSQAYLGALRALADLNFTHRRYMQALELIQRALRVDNLNEDLYCQAMRVCSALGDRAGLAHQYRDLKDILNSELGMEPLASTTKLYQRLIESL